MAALARGVPGRKGWTRQIGSMLSSKGGRSEGRSSRKSRFESAAPDGIIMTCKR
jgi:hypothetical protein